MGGSRFTHYFFIIALLLLGVISSCQKDEHVKDSNADQTKDSTLFSAADNYLAGKGTLTITIADSTYSFDAAKDSIAFVNVHSGTDQYFGITAINKAHDMSFGISSAGYALSNVNTAVAGSQFILKAGKQVKLQYVLSDHIVARDSGKVTLSTYKQDSVLARGTFYTFFATGEKVISPALKVKGTFNLKLK